MSDFILIFLKVLSFSIGTISVLLGFMAFMGYVNANDFSYKKTEEETFKQKRNMILLFCLCFVAMVISVSFHIYLTTPR